MLTKTFSSRVTLRYSLNNFARQLHTKQNVTKPVSIENIHANDKHNKFIQQNDIEFSDPNLIHQVCTHKSLKLHHAPTNERLEFLGEKVIQLYIVEYFVNKVPPDHLKIKIKYYTKDYNKLGRIGMNLGLNNFLHWTPVNEAKMIKAKEEGQEIPPSGEESVTGKALIALVGALYHDKGAYAAKNFIHKYILSAEDTLFK
ncbi:13171_t:CDS:2 [Funneliformis geosporum]|uniref:11288_t:CDS:1 n=1 Tax=Funneliformis geosporum TaxID=1117311 RepID=A0A9W4WQA6_9GLOM|nr:11288_t:CDS:2 [Funneliformis geosporum]CAI2172813.1 13171_t:CDS:2 [Funneliformis geosporum]